MAERENSEKWYNFLINQNCLTALLIRKTSFEKLCEYIHSAYQTERLKKEMIIFDAVYNIIKWKYNVFWYKFVELLGNGLVLY
jgi:hypothetical protein